MLLENLTTKTRAFAILVLLVGAAVTVRYFADGNESPMAATWYLAWMLAPYLLFGVIAAVSRTSGAVLGSGIALLLAQGFAIFGTRHEPIDLLPLFGPFLMLFFAIPLGLLVGVLVTKPFWKTPGQGRPSN